MTDEDQPPMTRAVEDAPAPERIEPAERLARAMDALLDGLETAGSGWCGPLYEEGHASLQAYWAVPSDAHAGAGNTASGIFDHKWLDPECVVTGCQSLLLRQRAERAEEIAGAGEAALLIERLRAPIDWAHFVSDDHMMDYVDLMHEAADALAALASTTTTGDAT